MKMPQPSAGPQGLVHRGFAPPVLTASVFGTTENVNMTSMSTPTVGGETFFEISGLAPGEYTLEFPGENGQGQGASTQIDLTSDQVLDRSSVPSGTEVIGTLTMAFGASAPDNLSISLAPVNGRRRGSGQKVSDKGAFTFHDVAPGLYELIVTGGGQQLAVLHIKTAGKEIDGGRLQIGSEAVTLDAAVAIGSATISGFVQQSGHGLGGAMVVLVPHNHGSNSYLFRRDQSDSDGSFTLNGVVPG